MSPEQAADEVARLTGWRPSASAVRKWYARGVAGHRLAVRRVGGRTIIAPADLRLFLDAVSRTSVAA